MGVHDAPQWLVSAFVRSCTAAGATAPRQQIEITASRLLERWADESRFHHNVKHLVDMLAKVDQLAEETHHPELVRLAAWYHGAVFSSAPSTAYAQRGGEDEVASAELASEELTALGVPEKSVRIVHDVILGIARHRDAVDVDTQALCDAELATLAVEPQRYAEYRRSIRKEYAHIPLRDYLTSRIAILTKLLARKNLFASPLGQPWEQPARQNLSAELQRLRDELARLGADDDGGLASAAPTMELPLLRPGGAGGTPASPSATGTFAPVANGSGPTTAGAGSAGAAAPASGPAATGQAVPGPAVSGQAVPGLTTTASGAFAAAPSGATSTGIPTMKPAPAGATSTGIPAVTAAPGGPGGPGTPAAAATNGGTDVGGEAAKPTVTREPIIKRFEKTAPSSKEKPVLPGRS